MSALPLNSGHQSDIAHLKSGRRNLLAGGARLNSFIFGSPVGRFLCVGILLWCSAFLSSHSFRDFFLRAGTGLSYFYRCRNLTQDRADHSRTGGPSGSGGGSSSIGNFASEHFGFFSGDFPCSYNSSRYGAFTLHFHSNMTLVERPSRSG